MAPFGSGLVCWGPLQEAKTMAFCEFHLTVRLGPPDPHIYPKIFQDLHKLPLGLAKKTQPSLGQPACPLASCHPTSFPGSSAHSPFPRPYLLLPCTDFPPHTYPGVSAICVTPLKAQVLHGAHIPSALGCVQLFPVESLPHSFCKNFALGRGEQLLIVLNTCSPLSTP